MNMSRSAQKLSKIFIILLACSAAAAAAASAATSTGTPESASAQTDRIDCKNVQCPPIRCPVDSEPFVEQQTDETKNINYKDDYDANNIDDNDEDGTETRSAGEQQNRRHVSDFNEFYVESSDDQDQDQDQENRTMVKRSLEYKRREPIKIVPGDYISLVPEVGHYHNFGSVNHQKWKRDSALPAQAESMTEVCCPTPKCICKNSCVKPQCPNPNDVLIETKPGNLNNPGECCPVYECTKEPNCTDIVDNKLATWVQTCKTCQCLAGHKICHNTCQLDEEERLPKNCLSSSLDKMFFEGDAWQEDECTQCQCLDSEKKCQTSMCKPLNCAQRIKLDGECCPICVEVTTKTSTTSTTRPTLATIAIGKAQNPSTSSFLPASVEVETQTTTNTPQFVSSSSSEFGGLATELPIQRICDPEPDKDIERIVLYIGISGLILICALFAYLWRREKNKKQIYGPVPSFDSNLNRLPTPITTA